LKNHHFRGLFRKQYINSFVELKLIARFKTCFEFHLKSNKRNNSYLSLLKLFINYDSGSQDNERAEHPTWQTKKEKNMSRTFLKKTK
jgi:hypothetical protein